MKYYLRYAWWFLVLVIIWLLLLIVTTLIVYVGFYSFKEFVEIFYK